MITEAYRLQRLPVSAEESKLVQEELERILANAHFTGSKRYPAMLRYVVEQTLAGKQAELKERTIGIEVFGRNPGYDTGSDPVVRFSAGEIRKRLAQVYAEEVHASAVRFELPLGSYVPHLLWEAEEAKPLAAETSPHSEALPPEAAALPLPRVRSSTAYWRRAATLCCLAVAVLAVSILGAWWVSARRDPVAALWEPLLQQNAPIVLSVGQPAQGSPLPIATTEMSINQHLVQPSFRISMPTAHVIAEVGGFLRAHRQPFHVEGAEATSLADLYEKPVVLVGAIDNRWTLNLLQPMRFHFISNGTVSYIEDTSRPEFRAWQLDFSQPYMKQTVDYAILGRFVSPVTNAPILVIAGIGANGNEAATEYALNPRELRALFKKAPKNWAGVNFEAVLRVNVMGGDTGGATVIASRFW